MNFYTYGFTTKCPNNSHYIYYTFKLEINKTVMVEDIIKKCSEFKEEYHEDIADNLFRVFTGKQTLTAVHQNVKIKTLR